MTEKTTDPGHNRVTRFIHTWSGRRVDEPGGGGAPTIRDVAVMTGRTPRFAGATGPPWFVLHHLLACGRMARAWPMDVPWRTELVLAALVHDAHEGPTGDMPSPFKCGCVSEFQAELDVRIADAWGIPDFDPGVHEVVRKIDRAALFAEGLLVGPPGKDWIPREEVKPWARDAVLWVREKWPDPRESILSDGDMVFEYCAWVNDLMEELT